MGKAENKALNDRLFREYHAIVAEGGEAYRSSVEDYDRRKKAAMDSFKIVHGSMAELAKDRRRELAEVVSERGQSSELTSMTPAASSAASMSARRASPMPVNVVVVGISMGSLST